MVNDMNEMDYGLTYGCVAEFLNDTSLWFEPITDEIDGLVLRDGNDSIIEMWLPIKSAARMTASISASVSPRKICWAS